VIKHRKLAPPLGPGGAHTAHLVNGSPVGFPAGARQPSSPIFIINSLLLIPGLGGGIGLRWGIGVGNSGS